jgi:hypothetical protein
LEERTDVTPLRAIVLVAAAAACVTLASGCGGGGDGDVDEATVSSAVLGLFAIDHDGARPEAGELTPYTTAFRRLLAGCTGSIDELASSIAQVSSDASNGSGTHITALETLQAAAQTVGREQEDCAGFFVGLEARLEGGAA